MNTPLRILLLEDSVEDTRFIQRRLEQDGMLFTACRVHTEADYRKQLQEFDPGLILADYTLPGYDGLSALALKQRLCPEVPFIFVSGTMGEETAIEALKKGAVDYVLKDRLGRLVPAIRRALGEHEARGQRARAEEALRKSEARFATVFRSGPIAMSLNIVSDGRLLDANEQYCEFFGYTREEMIGRTVAELKLWADPADRAPVMRRLLQEGSIHGFETKQRRKSGEVRDVLASLELIELAGEREPVLISMFTDVTQRKQAEAELASERTLLRTLVDLLPDFIYVKDRESRFLAANTACARGMGVASPQVLIGKTDADFYDARSAAGYRADELKVLEGIPVMDKEDMVVLPDGSQRVLLTAKVPLRDRDGTIIGLVGSGRDITERKEADRKLEESERQMLRAQRLESIGTLAGGVAHDLNNALAPILMATELLRLEQPDTGGEYLELIQTGAKRGADMVRQLLTFAKGAEGHHLLLQSGHLFRQMEKLIKSTFPKNIQSRVTCAKDLYPVRGDPTQLDQVLLNLCVNARDAMPHGGMLTLSAANLELDAMAASSIPEAKPGRYVVWQVTDTGTGIPAEVLERIFEPFFTTKGPDLGTGLGLSTVIGLVKSHEGFVRVQTAPGQGSTFSIYLPAATSDEPGAQILPEADLPFRGQGETILVVDDEIAVRNVARALLTRLNFHVCTAADGCAALVQVAERRDEIRAVITDVQMPRMDGLTFVRALKVMLPEAGIIIASGRVEERELNEFKALGITALLHKPFTQAELVAALKLVFPE